MREKTQKSVYLDKDQLASLTVTWENWVSQAQSHSRILARSRLYLHFLLARYGGMRTSEIGSFNFRKELDCQTGLLQLKNRSLFLPPVALRPIRRILSLPESQDSDFLKIDAGFIRKTFYRLGRLAQLPPEACAPRSLRYSRALEMLNLHVPAHIVSRTLDIKSSGQIMRMLADKIGVKKRINHFFAILAFMETDLRTGRLVFELSEGIFINSLASLEMLALIEPRVGDPVEIRINPGLIFLSDTCLPMANHLQCTVSSFTRDLLENRITLRCGDELELVAFQDASVGFYARPRPDDIKDVYIPAHAISVCGKNNQ